MSCGRGLYEVADGDSMSRSSSGMAGQCELMIIDGKFQRVKYCLPHVSLQPEGNSRDDKIAEDR